MPFQSGAHMTKSQQKKLESDKKREAKALELAESADIDEADVGEKDTEVKAVVIDQRKGGTSHNCPAKDAATNHPITKRCLKARHVGVCPGCSHLVSAKYGCTPCGHKKDELKYEKVNLTREPEKEEDGEIGATKPRGKTKKAAKSAK